MGICPACSVPLPVPLGRLPRNPRKWCSESCRVWAYNNPGQHRKWTRPARCGHEVPTYPGPQREWCSGCIPPKLTSAIQLCTAPGCSERARSAGMCKPCYRRANRHRWQKDPDRERARQRLKTYRRKDWSRLTDITPEYEMALRTKAKRCPLCEVKLTDQPYVPNSKELDHIIPKGVGGTHTIGNVRIICRSCNLRRPKDGSDYVGQTTLWAEVA